MIFLHYLKLYVPALQNLQLKHSFISYIYLAINLAKKKYIFESPAAHILQQLIASASFVLATGPQHN